MGVMCWVWLTLRRPDQHGHPLSVLQPSVLGMGQCQCCPVCCARYAVCPCELWADALVWTLCLGQTRANLWMRDEANASMPGCPAHRHASLPAGFWVVGEVSPGWSQQLHQLKELPPLPVCHQGFPLLWQPTWPQGLPGHSMSEQIRLDFTSRIILQPGAVHWWIYLLAYQMHARHWVTTSRWRERTKGML